MCIAFFFFFFFVCLFVCLVGWLVGWLVGFFVSGNAVPDDSDLMYHCFMFGVMCCQMKTLFGKIHMRQ